MAAMREPLALVLRREEVMPEIASEVVVAEVPVALTKVKFCKVVEAVASKFLAVTRPPLLTANIVVEALSNTSKDRVPANESAPQTVNLLYGVVVPMPTLPR